MSTFEVGAKPTTERQITGLNLQLTAMGTAIMEKLQERPIEGNLPKQLKTRDNLSWGFTASWIDENGIAWSAELGMVDGETKAKLLEPRQIHTPFRLRIEQQNGAHDAERLRDLIFAGSGKGVKIVPETIPGQDAPRWMPGELDEEDLRLAQTASRELEKIAAKLK